MEIVVNVGDEVFDKLYQNHCGQYDSCHECPSQVVMGDDYDDCYDKYAQHCFKDDLGDAIRKVLENDNDEE